MLNFDVKMKLTERLAMHVILKGTGARYFRMHPDGDKTRMVTVMKDGTATLCTESPDECEESITIKGDEVETWHIKHNRGGKVDNPEGVKEIGALVYFGTEFSPYLKGRIERKLLEGPLRTLKPYVK
ncbi:MAG: hypothetical protein KKH88_01860 [Nanoarchaeota archaeon]|nr:hypothetical protein [Nanoarchaeota archaeon]